MIRLPHARIYGTLGRLLLAVATILTLAQASAQPASAAVQIDIPGPIGSGIFGSSVTALPNGNFVVLDSKMSSEGKTRLGAVYLYDGKTGTMISQLTGENANDQVGSGGVVVLANSNFVVISPFWNRPVGGSLLQSAGAVTWVNGRAGLNGLVSVSNSLVGSSLDDVVGSANVQNLPNGNYVVMSSAWDNGAIVDAGAVTWGNGATGTAGDVSPSNSLVGSTPGDALGYGGVTALTNGNYVVSSPFWDDASVVDAGAVTWGNGTTGVVGYVSFATSLIGGTNYDNISSGGVTALSNGNFVVCSPYWSSSQANSAGAVTLGNGAVHILGIVSASNSLVGGSV